MFRSETFRRSAVRCLMLLVAVAGYANLTGCRTVVDEDRRGHDYHDHDHDHDRDYDRH